MLTTLSSAHAAEPEPRRSIELGAAGVFSYGSMDGARALAGGGLLRAGARWPGFALAGEADIEIGSNHDLTARRFGARVTAAWVHGPLRLGGGLGLALRDSIVEVEDATDSKLAVAISPMLDVSLDFVRGRYFAGYVGARARLDVMPSGADGAQLVPAGQALLGFRILP